MKKIIFNIDSFIVGSFKVIIKLNEGKGFFVSFLILFAMIILMIIYAIPIIMLQLIYRFIDRNELIKEYEKVAKK